MNEKRIGIAYPTTNCWTVSVIYLEVVSLRKEVTL